MSPPKHHQDEPGNLAEIVIAITLDAALHLENEDAFSPSRSKGEEIEPDLLREFMRRRAVQEVKTFCEINGGLLNENKGDDLPIVYLSEGEIIENEDAKTLRLAGTMALSMPKVDWLKSGLQGQRRHVKEAARAVQDYGKRTQPLLSLPKIGGTLTFIDLTFDLDQVTIEES